MDIPYILRGKYFTIVDRDNLAVRAECCACKKVNPHVQPLSGAINATSNFKTHLKRKHSTLCDDYEKEKSQESKRKKHQPGRGQTTVTDNFVAVDAEKSISRYDKMIAKFIVKGMHPLSVVEQQEFIDLLKGFDPDFKGMSRKHLTDILSWQFRTLREDISAKMGKAEFICITADAWTCDGKQRGFLGLTAHWINQTLDRESAALACRRFKGSHTYDRIAELINMIMKEYNVPMAKVVKAVTDNGSNFVKAFLTYPTPQTNVLAGPDSEDEDEAEAGCEFNDVEGTLAATTDEETLYQLPPHQRCASHTLSLICTSDLKSLSSKIHRSAFAKCQGIWNRISKSTSSSENVRRICDKALVRPCATRWNSLYDSLVCLLKYEESLDIISEATGIAKFTGREVMYLKEFMVCVKPVANALDKLQAENDMYFGKLLPALLAVERKLTELSNQTMEECKNVASILLTALQKRFGVLLKMEDKDAIIASMSHPFFKLRWIPEEKLEEFQNMFINLVHQLAGSVQSGSGSTPLENEELEIDDFYGFAHSQQPSVQDVSLHKTKDECYRYFQDQSQHLSMLSTYPSVLVVFKKYNTPLPSSAPVERLFSYSKMILEPNRRRLTDENFEMLTLLKVN